ncbi:conserved hypothetical protein [Burkholderiales bacterium 8X]|nr:conserved hypothetical protein [Burkholderiales bacterium 8X]
MSKTYLLIDLQNRRPAPEQVALWMGTTGEAWIFFGDQEVGMLGPYMELGRQVSLVDISRPGKNSLDFHLVLYLGYLIGRREVGARFVIVAADGDYDPAVAHARSKGLLIERLETLGSVPPRSIRETNQPGGSRGLPAPAIALPTSVNSTAASKAERTKSVESVSLEICKDLVEAGKPKTLVALQNRIEASQLKPSA